MRRLRLAVVTAASALVACVVQAAPAAAANGDVMVVQGSGNLAPGVTATVTANAVNFAGTATVVGTNGIAVNYGCNWAGTEIGNIAASEGVVAGGCGPITFSDCVTVRVVSTWTMTCDRADTQIGTWHLTGQWVPRQTPPSAVTGYSLAAEGGFAQINSP